ncbi:MAG: zinc-binding dehydrogenase, partial [Intestinibacter sp.]
TRLITDIDENFKVDHAFECVGGPKSEGAISQIIDVIQPEGCINLLGVSEEPVDINTRMVLEKGLSLLGNSRSGYDDFEKAVELVQDKQMQEYLGNIISETIEIKQLNVLMKHLKEIQIMILKQCEMEYVRWKNCEENN